MDDSLLLRKKGEAAEIIQSLWDDWEGDSLSLIKIRGEGAENGFKNRNKMGPKILSVDISVNGKGTRVLNIV
jgi:hypothetical protein